MKLVIILREIAVKPTNFQHMSTLKYDTHRHAPDLSLILQVLVHSLIRIKSCIPCPSQKRNWKFAGVVNHGNLRLLRT